MKIYLENFQFLVSIFKDIFSRPNIREYWNGNGQTRSRWDLIREILSSRQDTLRYKKKSLMVNDTREFPERAYA